MEYNAGMEQGKFDALKGTLERFMAEHIYPNEKQFQEECDSQLGHNEWTHPEILLQKQQIAKDLGLWNLWLPNDTAKAAGPDYVKMGGGLNNVQYGELCEIMGTANHMEWASQCMNCASPDTGNMETLARFANDWQKEKWLKPLLEGKIRSCFAMTEPDMASSDATQVSIQISKDEAKKEYVINGRKWWITGAGSLHCKIMILMGKTAPGEKEFRQQSMILIPLDSTPGITLLRGMQVLGDPEAPKGHMDIIFEDVRVPFENVLAGEGRGFEIAQARLGPGRIHHCMRLIGTAERALSLLCRRSTERRAFGKQLAEFDNIIQDIGRSRAEIYQARLLVKDTADGMDRVGVKDASVRQRLSLCKAVVPQMVQNICDRAMQAHGAMGLSQDTPLAIGFAWARWLRFADGPCEVHWRTAARIELSAQKKAQEHCEAKGARSLFSLGHYEPDRSKIFRKTTDPISDKSKAVLARL